MNVQGVIVFILVALSAIGLLYKMAAPFLHRSTSSGCHGCSGCDVGPTACALPAGMKRRRGSSGKHLPGVQDVMRVEYVADAALHRDLRVVERHREELDPRRADAVLAGDRAAE